MGKLGEVIGVYVPDCTSVSGFPILGYRVVVTFEPLGFVSPLIGRAIELSGLVHFLLVVCDLLMLVYLVSVVLGLLTLVLELSVSVHLISVSVSSFEYLILVLELSMLVCLNLSLMSSFPVRPGSFVVLCVLLVSICKLHRFMVVRFVVAMVWLAVYGFGAIGVRPVIVIIVVTVVGVLRVLVAVGHVGRVCDVAGRVVFVVVGEEMADWNKIK